MEEKSSTNPLWLAVAALLIPQLFGLYQEHNKFKLEKAQFESNLILRAIEPSDRKKSVEAIRFLVRAGFISEEKILKAIQDTSLKIPTIAEQIPTPAPKAPHIIDNRALFAGVVVDAVTNRSLKGAIVSASADGIEERMITGLDGRFILHMPVSSNRMERGRRRPSSWLFRISRAGYHPYNIWHSGGMVYPANVTYQLKPIDQETIADKLFD